MSLHLLLVDDQLPLLESLARRLERRGFRVSKAISIAEACAVFDLGPVDVCVCDMQLDNAETGLDLLEYVTKHPLILTPIIILTGHEMDSQLVQDAVKKGAFSVFPKPTEFGLLLDCVKSASEKHIE